MSGITVQPQSGPLEPISQIRDLAEVDAGRQSMTGLLSGLLGLVRAQLGADTASVLLLDASRTVLETVASVGVDATVRQRARVPVGAGFAGRIAAEGVPRTVSRVEPGTVWNQLLIKRGISSLLGVPLVVDSELIGVLHVGSLAPRTFTEGDTATLQTLASPIAVAIRNQRSSEDRAAATALQRSLVPARLPVINGLDLAARYIPTAGEIGGDWYDVFTLPEGRVGIVIGDVAGHGLGAAVVMGRLRSALRSYALDYHDPAEVLCHLDRKAHHFEAGIMATVLYAVSIWPYETMEISLAGHLPPLTVVDELPAIALPLLPDLPLGVDLSRPRRSATVQLAVGTSLCVFTDGLIERRPSRSAVAGRNVDQISQGLAQLQAAFRPGDAETAAAHIIDSVLPENPPDDVALLVLRREPDRLQQDRK